MFNCEKISLIIRNLDRYYFFPKTVKLLAEFVKSIPLPALFKQGNSEIAFMISSFLSLGTRSNGGQYTGCFHLSVTIPNR